MKRGAEKQLIKDGAEEEDEDVEPGQGMKVADEAVLAQRKIKGLPKRSLSQSPAPAPAPPPQAPPVNGSAATNSASKFPSFSGFGSASGSSSFTFAPSASTNAKPASNTPASNSSFSFASSTPPSSGTSLFSGFGSSSSVASSASSTTKAFASVLGSSTSRADPPGPISISKPDLTKNDEDEAALKYYKSLRGLNSSFLSAISKAVESDPFIDIAEVLEQYKKHRISVQHEFEEKATVPQSTAATRGSETPKLTPAVTSPPTSMPAPPSGFAGFSAPSAASTPAASPGGGFTPKPTTESSSSFSFGTPAASSTTAAVPAPPKSAFSFGQSATSLASTDSAPSPPKSSFAFGSSSDSPFAPKPFNAAKKDSTSPGATSIFGSSSSTKAPTSGFTFGSGSPQSSGLFGSTERKGAEESKDIDDKAPASSFGASTTKPLFGGTTSFSFSTPEKSKSSFDAGNKTISAFSGFGSAGGPVGFGFSSKGGEASPPAAKAIGFSFGTPPKTEASAGETPAESRSETPATEGSEDGLSRVLSPGVHDQEGEGEEDEETTHAVRTKVFKMSDGKDGEKRWVDMGVGMLRLKKHKETPARRAILRNSSTGKIIINFRIYPGLKPTLGKKNAVSFIGHGEDGSAIPYMLRFSKPEDGADLKAALEREVELVKKGE